MQYRAVITVLILAGLLQAGCSRFARRPPKSYTTIVTDLHHDAEKARADCERAATFFDKGNLVKAEAALQEALIADVSYAPAHNNLGRIYFDQGNLYLAAWEFEYARRLLPDSAEVTNNLGMIHEAADQTERAIEYYSMALSLDEGNPVYGGNLARVLTRADRDPEQVAALLQDLLFNDMRPEWVGWARDQLNLHQPVRAAAHSQPTESAVTAEQPEAIEPLPIPYRADDLELPEQP